MSIDFETNKDIKTGRVNIVDKKIINGQTDVNQLVPFKYKWAWDKYLASCANHWMPQEVNMQRDIELWKSPNGLTDDERLIVKRNLGFFTTADSLAANNIVLGTYRQITAPECRQFLLRQAFEECHIEGTEILTSNGFLDFKHLTKDHKVAQFCPKTKEISFVKPLKVINNHYVGDIYDFSGRFLNQTVTENHRMPVMKEKTKEITFVEAKDAKYSHNEFPLSGHLRGKDVELSMWERFLIATQADGTILKSELRNGSRSGTIMVTFAFAKQRKIDRMISILDELKFKHSISAKRDFKNRLKFYVYVPLEFELHKNLDWVDLSNVGIKWCEEFLKEVSLWDGHQYKNGDYIKYVSKHKINVDIIQALAHLCGKTGSYSLRIDNRKESFSNMHSISICNRVRASRGTTTKTKSTYAGNVYCVRVETGAFIVRKNNKVSVSGNCIHSHSYQYIVESLGMDESEVFNAYHEIESIKNKDEFLIPFIDTLTDPLFKTGTLEDNQKLLKSLIVFACIMEGMFFYVGFVQILALGRQNKMTGAAEQYQYILRDESMHCNFGIDLINTIKLENPELWTEEFKTEIIGLFKRGVELEYEYAEDTMPRGVLGLNASMFKEYLQFICNRRMTQIGLPELFQNAGNPFPWMSEMMDLKKEKNFFETRVTEYQSGGALDWD